MDAREGKGTVIRGTRWIAYLFGFVSLVQVPMLIIEVLRPRGTVIGWLAILASSLWVLGVFPLNVAAYINIRIFLYTDRLVYRTILRKTNEIPYRSIKSYTRTHGQQICIYDGEKTYKIFLNRKAGLDELETIPASHVEKNK